MNKHRFRIIFNVARGLMMVVGELVKSHTAGAESTRNSHHDSLSTEAITNTSLTLRPLAFLLMCALGLVSILPNPANISTAQAEVIADPNAPANKRPYVFAAPNGVEVVNIQTPGAAGVSHMFYTKLNVPENGLIFNNSRTNVQSQLGGWLQGNPLLATGTARIILNEVTSNHPSYLNGYMEIAGSRAQLIIANPNGISCNGCGFINASRGVLTTGTPILSGGDLTGYRVTSGTIHIGGNGLDASRSNYTDIIARAVEVNAGIWANDLKLTTGANQVNVDNTQAAMIAGNSAAPASGFALDVADLGGMYAGKITLIGTEAGLGVRNAGTISASSGNLTLTVDGRLENSNTVISQGDTVINITQTISNTGTLYAQGNVSLTTQANIDNNGLVAAQGSADLLANGVNSYINNTADSVVAAGLKADGTLISSAGVTANLNISATQSVRALGQNLAAGNQTLTAKQLDISGSDTVANHLSLLASNGDIQAQNATVNANQTLTASTMHSLTTNGAILSANQFNLSAHDISNIGGTLIQTGTGDITINLAGDLDNSQGRIATNSHNLILAAHTITNISNNGYQASIEHAGSGQLVIHSMAFDGSAGQIISNGVLNLTATTADMNNGSAIAKQINIDTATLGNQRGEIIQTGSGATNIKATSQLDNSAGVIASNGNTTLTVGNLVNQGGSLKAAGSANLTINATGSVNNSMDSGIASIQAGGALTVNADSVDNTHSEITAGATLNISTASNSNGLQNAQGLIAANQALTLNAASLNNSNGNIASVDDSILITARTGSINNSTGKVTAAKALTTSSFGLNNTAGTLTANIASINSQLQALANSSGSIITDADLDLQTGTLTNDSGLIQSGANLNVNTHGQTLVNSNSGSTNGILSQGDATFTTGNLNNQTGYIGAKGAIMANSTAINNSNGTITGEAAITIKGSSIDNQSGRVEALADIEISAANIIDNRAGLLRSGQALYLTTGTLDNRNTQNANNGIEGSAVNIHADNIDNSSGSMLTDNNLLVTGTNTFNNTQGKVSSGGTLQIIDKLADASSNVTTKKLAVINTGGTIIAGNGITPADLYIDSKSLTGYGKVLSQGSLSTKLTTDYSHSGEWQADGNASFTTTGNISNQAKLLAGGNLDIIAANIDNKASGEITGANLKVNVADTLTNRGLLDGGDTFINTTTLNNIGTGRIYGDHVTIAATTINNGEETINGITKAAVIAARERLDIGASNIINREHALLFSAGDMAIGGSLDANHQATIGAGQLQAKTLNNNSATIEALGNLSLNIATINNTNKHLTTRYGIISESTTPARTTGYPSFSNSPAPAAGNTRTFQFAYDGSYATFGRIYNYDEVGFYTDGGGFVHMVIKPGVANDGTLDNATFFQYNHGTIVSETQLLTTDPGQILAGGSMQINATDVLNDDSKIVAGGALSGNISNLNNHETTGIRSSWATAESSLIYPRQSCDCSRYLQYPGDTAPVIETINLGTSTYLGNAKFTGTNTQVAALNTGSVTQSATGAGNANVAVVAKPNPGSNTQVAPVITNTSVGAGTVVRTVNPNTMLPNNSLFHPNPNPTGNYLIETDPRFANYRNWLSSDYILKALSYDPATITKRLGDGFYEQKLIREQVAQLTGKRFLTGYADDEAEYQALMSNGATFAKAYQLIPGVALTEAQIAQLTSDIVWLIEQTITLPDGSTVQALVPQVYVKLKEGDLDGAGSLLAADSINLKLTGDLTNSGTIAGRRVVAINADNINNLQGRISANNTNLNARTDINNLGGQITGHDTLTLEADHDINIASTTKSNRMVYDAAAGKNTIHIDVSRTNIDRVAGLYVDNPNGILVASSGNNLNLQGAIINNNGDNGLTVLNANNDIKLDTIATSSNNSYVRDARNYQKNNSTEQVGSSIQTQGNLTLNAGNNLSARAANVTSEQGTLNANAGNNLTIEAGIDTSHSESASYSKKKGSFSSKSKTTRDTYDSTNVVSSTFSGEQVNLNANNDITIIGSNVVATQDVNLNAGNNITLTTEQATHDETHYSKTKKSGFSSSGSSVGYGSSKLTTTNDTQTVTNVGSTIGSVQGDVNINAGKDYTQTASDVLSPQGDINITAQSVDINAANDSYANQQTLKYKQSGITIGVSSSALNLAKSVAGTTEAAVNSDSPRNKTLNALQTYANGSTLYDQGKAITSAVQAGNVQDAASAAGVRLSISIGSSSAKSSSSTNVAAQQGSLIKAGGDVNIKATQDDLTVKGSKIEADKNITLEAAKNINLVASADTESNQSKNKSSSTSIGVSVGVGAGGAGLSVDLAASRGKGSANSDSATYNNTHVTAGETLTLNAADNANLIGANAAGKKIIANIGGDLNIRSLQDVATSKAKQSNTGISVSVPVASPTLGNTFGAVSQSKQNSNSNYASVYEQSGIKAGEEGFDIKVNHNTDLKGALIESTAPTEKNQLTTGTLTVSNIQNHMDAEASSSGTTISTNMLNSKYGAIKGIVGNLQNHGEADISDSSTTLSAISPANIKITDETKQQTLTGNKGETTVALLNRDTANTNRVLAKPDVQALQDKAQQEQADRMLFVNTVIALADNGVKKIQNPTLHKVFCVQEPCRNDQQKNNKLIGEIALDIFLNNPGISAEEATSKAIEAITGPDGDSSKADPQYAGSDPNREVKPTIDSDPIKNIQTLPTSLEELANLSNEEKQTSSVFANGIFNSLQRGAELAMQQTPTLDPNNLEQLQRIAQMGNTSIGNTFIVHTDKANTFIGEFIVAGIEKAAEIFGIATPASELKADVIQALSTNNATKLTDNELFSIAQSRGTMTDSGMLSELAARGFYNPNLMIIENNPAAEQTRLEERAAKITDPQNLYIWAPSHDPVPTFIGGYGDNYTGSAASLTSLFGTNYSVHSSPGAGAVGSLTSDVDKPYSYEKLNVEQLNAARATEIQRNLQLLFNTPASTYVAPRPDLTMELQQEIQTQSNKQINQSLGNISSSPSVHISDNAYQKLLLLRKALTQ